MALKTFNVDEQIYKEFSKHCKKNGISMSRQIENFLRNEIEKIKFGAKNLKNLEKPETREAGVRKESNKTDTNEHPLSKYC